MSRLVQKARQLEDDGYFLGGPAPWFETAGQKIMMALLNEGMTPESRVLDVGCGCLRGGYWLIHFLDPECYCGIEPNVDMLDAGRTILMEPDEMSRKQPRFDHNDKFDFSVFDETFDFYVARSVWTHSARRHIRTMLDQFIDTSSDEAVFLASYESPPLFGRGYLGDDWVGKSHESDEPGIVRHRFRWIRDECNERGLYVREVRDDALNFGQQTWLSVKRTPHSVSRGIRGRLRQWF